MLHLVGLQVDDDSMLHEDEGAGEPSAAAIDRRPAQQKTATQRNRAARRKAADSELLKRKQRKALGKDILRAPDLVAEIEAEADVHHYNAQRRKVWLLYGHAGVMASLPSSPLHCCALLWLAI